MEYEQTKLNNFLDSMSRGRWLILGGILLGATCGLLLYLTQDKVYKSEALLSYQQQGGLSQPVLNEQVAMDDVVSAVIPEVMSRDNLEKLIKDQGIQADLLVEHNMDHVVEAVRENLNIVPSRTGDSVTIEYSGVDPAQTALTADALAESFIEESSEYQRERVLEVIAAQKNELSRVQEMLVQKEAAMRDYKKTHYNEMPTQQPVNKARLAALQDEYQARQDSFQELERKSASIQDKINEIERLISETQGQADGQGQDTSININQRTTLEMLQNSLAEMRDLYPEQHPMVQRLKKQIASMEKLIREEERVEKERGSAVQKTDEFDEELQYLRTQFKDISLDINGLKKQNQEIQVQISRYQEWINAAPAREAEWSSLMQEFAKLKQQYDALARQHLQASSALSLDGGQLPSRFGIDDKARIPATPIKPDYIIFMILSSMVGLLAGGLLAFGLEAFDSSFKERKVLEQTLGIPVICSVPNLPLTAEMKKKRYYASGRVVFLVIWFTALCVATIIMVRDGKLVSSLF